MEGYISIGELSEILGIEKSKLRYWDQNGLIHLERNEDNNYREYSKEDVIEISDIAFYRSINIPIKKLKTINSMSIEQLETTLLDVEEEIRQEMESLKAKQRTIEWRKKHIKRYQELMLHPYQVCKPDMEYVVGFDFKDKEIWSKCLYDPYQYGVYYDKEQEKMFSAYVTKEASDYKVLWKNDPEKEYVVCIVECVSKNYQKNEIKEHIKRLESQGKTVGEIAGRYLFTAYEEVKIDYHIVWIEIL